MDSPSHHKRSLPAELAESLALLRKHRRFDVDRTIAAKVAILNSYLRRSSVQACVVGVSGGVDSALTLGLLRRAADTPGSPIRRLVAVLAPLDIREGVSNQDIALRRGLEVSTYFNAEIVEADLGASHDALKSAVDRGFGVTGNAWSSGQLASTIRTPALYYVTSLLTQEGTLALLCGTTNRDEGSYLGFFGKASDGMVDLQVISDLHKSEVYALARRLGVPEEICTATPTGDTFDGRVDETMIGAPYDFVELYTGLLALGHDEPASRARIERSWGPEARDRFCEWASAIEALHRHNHHKYISGAAAIHCDVYPRNVPGGWSAPPPITPPRGRFIAEFELDPEIVACLQNAPKEAHSGIQGVSLADFGDSLIEVTGLLSSAEVADLRRCLLAQEHVQVGPHGTPESPATATERTGSRRASTYSPTLATALWRRLRPALPPLRIFSADDPNERQDHPVWRPIGLSPLFRGIIYDREGELVPHYDSTFDFGDGQRRTLMSVLIDLGGAHGTPPGCTRFLVDRQRHLRAIERDFSDHSAAANPRDIIASGGAGPGSALVFDHRLLHEGARHSADTPRVVLRADVVFTRCGPPLPPPPPTQPIEPELRLGVEAGANASSLDQAYATHLIDPQDADPAAIRSAWRLLRDRHYSSAFRRLAVLDAATDMATMIRAGWLDDGISPAELDARENWRGPQWRGTPLYRLQQRLADLQRAEDKHDNDEALKRPLVLLTTGAFCPIHRGHIEMMELARNALETRGAAVLGGYISVSHDSYVLAKCGLEGMAWASSRLAMCEAAIADSDWLMVDPWEALACDRAVNFTEVIRHLESYLQAHLRLHRAVEVVYVFGSDNADFCLAFADRGRCVCVPRPGEQGALGKLRLHPALADHERIIVGDKPTPKLASASIRAGDEFGLRDSVRELWHRACARQTTPLRLTIRDEASWALVPWLRLRDPEMLLSARERHFKQLCALLRRTFAAADRPLDLEICELRTQLQRAQTMRERARLLSLDPCVPGDLNLGVSRCFEMATDIARPGLVARPGSPPIQVQIANLPVDRTPTILFDDDLVSGRSIACVRELLGERLLITEVQVLSSATRCSPGKPQVPGPHSDWELCDARDLLPAARDSGLVIALPDGNLARAPYLLPYVRPSGRLQIPLGEEISFCKEAWILAAEFFAAITPPLRVADADPAFRQLASYVGFTATSSLEELCRWHAAQLRVKPN